jgi:hypothetical protein
MSAKPEIRFYDAKTTPAHEVVAQMHGDRRVGVHCRIMEWNSDRFVSYTRYDPGLVLPRHSHHSDSLIYILDGEVSIDGRSCPAGTQIVLPKGAPIGPLIAGPEGCTFLESYLDDAGSAVEDQAGYDALLVERGIVALPGVQLSMPSR